MVKVLYQWTFVPNDPVPVGGSIQLIFPPNIYNLQTTPAPKASIYQGLLDQSTAVPITFTFGTNLLTITGFSAVAAGTLIRVGISGVSNPPSATSTSNFNILTKTAETYPIDSNLLISGITIIKANPQGTLVYNYFYCTPNNGLLRSNYYLSFYPQTNYPAGTIITISFPSTEFPSSAKFIAQTCYISGALTTMASCTYTAPTTFYVTTDTTLEIEAGMPPLQFYFPQIVNFNEELFSGVISVTASYGGVILDASGNSDTNRKAQTGKKSNLLTYNSFSFTPTTEAEIANYTVTLIPSADFDSNTVIQFEFPYEYPRGLGSNVVCFAP
jgi:hypothetical protein